MDDAGNLKVQFLTEAREHLETVEDDILKLEDQGEGFEPEVLNRLFRAMHSIKGGSAFLNLENIKQLAHALENVIDSIRQKKIVPNQHLTDLLLKGVDKLQLLLGDLDREAEVDIGQELSDIQQILSSPILASGQPESRPSQPVAHPQAGKTPPPGANPAQVVEKVGGTPVKQHYLYRVAIDLSAECDTKQVDLSTFFKNLTLLGELLEVDFHEAELGTLGQQQDTHLPVEFTIRTIIDDEEIFLEALELAPLHLEKQQEKLPAPPATPAVANRAWGERAQHNQETVTTHQEAKTVSARTVRSATPVQQVRTLDKGAGTLSQTGQSPQPKVNKTGEGVTTLAHARQKLAQKSQTSIRISVNLLDKLMNFASELVLVRNQNMQAVEAGKMDQLRAIAKKLNVVTSGLQAGILQTRMQPIDAVFSKFTRVVRDLSKNLGKEVSLQIEGKDVELDKNIVEALGDPLTHLVRNAVDHGIETPAEREAAGKPRAGRLLLGAYYKAGHVNILIQDNGQGMDPQALARAAVQKGLLKPGEAEALDEEEAFNLIFRPGFSTASGVTELSGRGVGMDVVKTNLQKIGGVIHIRSHQGKGTTFDIRLPLTLSIMQALIVLVEESCFAIPEFNISEIVHLYGEDIYKGIKRVGEQEVFSLRGKLIPVIRLVNVLRMRRTYADPRTHEKREERRRDLLEEKAEPSSRRRRQSMENSLYILVLNLGNIQYGLVIDKIIDTEEIVIKPLHSQLEVCRAYAGTTVLGDGRIAMILDIANVAELARFNINQLEKLNKKEKQVEEDRQTVLLFNLAGQETFAIHLFLISHIEKIRYADILVANDKEYFHFQEQLIRLVRLEETLDAVAANYLEEVFVIIIKARRPVGILVSQIIDTTLIGSSFEFEDTARPGIIGMLMIEGELTMVLDVFTVINQAEPGWFSVPLQKTELPRKILLLEDTKFYASLITSYLSGTGAEVVHAANGREGVELLAGQDFDLIISDLSMPEMDGFQFAAYLRQQPRYASVKLIAISAAYDTSKGKELALEAGFDEYVSKLDREGMLECLKSISSQEGVR